MIKHIFAAVFVAVLVGTACDAQSILTDTDTNINWGQSVNGVRFSIDTITNVIPSRSIVVVNAQIKNTSTNKVTVKETAPWKDFSVWLEDASGEKYLLSDNTKSITEDRNFIKTIRPGELDKWEIRLTLREEIKVGNYTLKATRKIKLAGEEFIVESNSFKIQIE